MRLGCVELGGVNSWVPGIHDLVLLVRNGCYKRMGVVNESAT